MKKIICCFPVITSIILTAVLGVFGVGIMQLINYRVEEYTFGKVLEGIIEFINVSIVGGIFISALFIYPVVAALSQVGLLLLEAKKYHTKSGPHFDQIAIWYGLILEYLYIVVIKQTTGADWHEQLANSEIHTPVYTGAGITVAFIFLIGIAGYCYLIFRPLKKIPPLMAVVSISAMYIWMIELIVFTVQVIGSEELDLYLLIYPFCIACIITRTVLYKVREWSELSMEKSKIHKNIFLSRLDIMLSKSGFWPLYALLFMLPFLGVIIGILMIFGQAPDSIIKAWTETSDWRLSMKVAPQNIYYDEHYLCTVAAGGHKKVVKPIRKGLRHGHEVIVNRQLCVANAFEQILEEKTPRLHRAVRSFYDRRGFPIAKLIRSKWVADLVYFLMKPVEWCFVMVIYVTDIHPENRIAVQYMGKIPEFRK